MNPHQNGAYAIQADQVEPLPLYTEEAPLLDGVQGLVAILSEFSSSPPLSNANSTAAFIENQQNGINGSDKKHAPDPIIEYPEDAIHGHPADETTSIRQSIVNHFFDAISKCQGEVIALFISHNLVTANTTSREKKTPLLAAIATRNFGIVQLLLESGADPNAFGIEIPSKHSYRDPEPAIQRTPLQLAASIGHLPIVKLLMEVHHANDALIAPDGQTALRLAATNHHREVVAYLPTRRGGGFRRWQHHHAKAIRRAGKALKKIFTIGKFFVWDLEKFFLWTVPKEVLVIPLAKGCVWCWRNKHFFLPWLEAHIRAMPGRFMVLGKEVWKGIKMVPRAAMDVGKEAWKFGTITLPRLVKELAIWVWKVLTITIPKATAIVARWISHGLSSMGKAVLDVFLKAVSLLHTAFEAVITFFWDLTLQDILNGLRSLLRAIFVTVPKTIWAWILDFSKMSLTVMTAVFGNLGECIWWVAYGIGWLVMYVPRKILVVLESLGGSFVKGWYEVMVFIRPKS